MKALLAAAAVSGLFFGSPAHGQSQQVDLEGARQERPPNVPREFVFTPNGYFHRSCVHQLTEGERLAGDDVLDPSGGRRRLPRCQFGHYNTRGAFSSVETTPPALSGWKARVWAPTNETVDWLSATWTVPAAPKNSARTIYLFPGLGSVGKIAQPVLAWNGLDAGAGWSIYSWYYVNDDPNRTVHGPAQPVTVGEAISGYVAGSGCDATSRTCTTWEIRTASPTAVSTLVSDSAGDVFDQAYAGVLESGTEITSCGDYPASGGIDFTYVVARTLGGAAFNPAWQTFEDPASPDCVTGISFADGTASIRWCVPTGTCGSRVCGPAPDGCGGTISCGTCRGTGRKCFLPSGDWYYAGQYCTTTGTCASNPCDF